MGGKPTILNGNLVEIILFDELDSVIHILHNFNVIGVFCIAKSNCIIRICNFDGFKYKLFHEVL
jgi:hypothetical protein